MEAEEQAQRIAQLQAQQLAEETVKQHAMAEKQKVTEAQKVQESMQLTQERARAGKASIR